MTTEAQAPGRVRVVCGANSQELAGLAGKRIAEVRSELTQVLNIPQNAQANISGGHVENDYRLQEGDTLEFVRPAGQKGSYKK